MAHLGSLGRGGAERARARAAAPKWGRPRRS